MKQKRYGILDVIRGMALFHMIAYHGIWDLVYLYGQNWSWYRGLPGYIWQQCICWTFILLSGFCHSLGKHPFRRGITVFGAGALLTVVTLFIIPENRVVFGILTFLGSSMILFVPLAPLLKKISPLWGLLFCMLLFFITRNINQGFLGFENWNFLRLPRIFYSNFFTTFFGFPSDNFYSTDYFSLFPWIFLYASGYFLYGFCKKHDLLQYFYLKNHNFLEFMGKHSLEIYLIHQPILYGLFFVFMKV